MIKNVGKQTIKSAIWLYGQKVAFKLLSLVSIAILARKLSPTDFGLVAIAGVLMSFIMLSTSATVGPYVINNHSDDFAERDQAAFWLNLTFTTAIVSVYFIAIPHISKFYNEPLLSTVLVVLSIKFLFAQLSVVPDSIVKRSLNYHQLVIRNTFLNFISIIISIIMALSGFGVWSLVIPDLLVTIPRFLIVLRMSKWKPKFQFHTNLWKEIYSYSKYIIAGTLLGGLINDGDTLILGRIAGSEQLAFYDRSWRTANLVSSNVVSVIGDVSQPAFSALGKSEERLRNAYTRTLRTLSIISFPLLIGMFVLADDLILTLYGPNWTNSIILLRVFTIFALQRSVFSITSTVYNVIRKPEIGFKLNLIQLPFYLIAIFIGGVNGILGVSIGVTIVRTIFGFIGLHYSCKIIHLSTAKVLRELIPSITISLMMGLILAGIRYLVLPFLNLSPLINLLLFTLIGASLFILFLVGLFPGLLNEVLDIMNSILPSLANALRHLFHTSLKRVEVRKNND